MLANGGCEHGQLGQSEYLMEVCNAWTSRPQLWATVGGQGIGMSGTSI
jgi:hypothetical protein